MTLQIGIFRLDTNNYTPYKACFKDISGLCQKSEVRIAGVKVGWIDTIELINDGSIVCLTLQLLKQYTLYQNAQALVRQEGMLGNKYVEIVPGDPLLPALPIGTTLKQVDNDFSSDDMLHSLRSFGQAAQHVVATAEMLQNLLVRNEEHITSVLVDMKTILAEVKDRLPSFSALGTDFLPQLADTTSRVAHAIELSADSLQSVTKEAYSSLQSINAIAQKINGGQGLIGKVINEETAYTDVTAALRGLRTAFDKVDRVAILVDSHSESMQNLAEERFSFRDTKGFANVRIHPAPDYFYLLGLSFSQKGYIWRKANQYRYFDEKQNEILPTELRKEGQLFDLVARKEVTKEYRDSFQPNLQIGKIFNNVALRVGIFEGSFGCAVDYFIPFANDSLKWVSTFEAYDFRGRNRLFNDTRPHFKWLNRLFVTPNLYFTFGADDFASIRNKTAFFGGGLRFADDDLKYALAYLPFGGCF